MTISNIYEPDSYTGDGSTTSFPVTFPFKGTGTAAEISVIEVVIATGAETTKVNGTDYTVTGGAGSTGTVVASSAPAATVRWVIRRNTTQTQETDYVENDPFPAESHEAALDRVTMIAQEQERDISRSVRLPDGYTDTFDTTLPGVITASTAIVVNSDGDGFETGPTTSEISNAQTYATNASDSASAAAVSAAAAAASAARFKLTNIAALTALVKSGLSNNDTAYVSGYTSVNDGGDGVFYWNSASTATEDNGTIFAADEGGAGRWVRILSGDIVTPKMFGAVFDNSTDDTTAFNNCASFANQASGPQYRIFLGAGTAYLNGTWTLNPNTTNGDIPSVFGIGPQGTKIRLGSSGKITYQTSHPMRQTVIGGFELEGSGSGGAHVGIEAVNSNFIQFRNINFDQLFTGIKWINEGAGSSEQNTLHDCWATDLKYFMAFSRNSGSTSNSFRGTGFEHNCHMDLTTVADARLVRVYNDNSLAPNCYNMPVDVSIWTDTGDIAFQNDTTTPIRACGRIRHESGGAWTLGSGSATDSFTGIIDGVANYPSVGTFTVTAISNTGSSFRGDLAYLNTGAYIGGSAAANLLGTVNLEQSWTPADGSGAALSLTINNAEYTQIGNTIRASANITWPATADTNTVAISGLPANVKNVSSARTGYISYSTATKVFTVYPFSTTVFFQEASGGANITNADLSGATVVFTAEYVVA